MSHIAPISQKVATTLAAYRIVAAIDGTPETVGYPASATVKPMGVTDNDVTDTNQAIGVNIAGIAKVQMAAAMTSGSWIASDSTGQGVKHVDSTAGSWIVGQLLSTAVTGTIARVLVNPVFKSIP